MQQSDDTARELAQRARTLSEAGRLGEAIAVLRTAVGVDAASADLHNDLGTVLAMAGELDAAIEAFRQALVRDPAHRQALGNAATAMERANRLDALGELLAGARARYPDDPNLLLVAGRHAARTGETGAARRDLQRAAGCGVPRLAREAAFALGHLLDRCDDATGAAEWFDRANAAWQAQYPDAARVAGAYLDELAALRAALAQWRAPPIEPRGAPDPIFLLGFPRSGNTLLATMLESHGAFAVRDEQPAFDALWAGFAGGLGALPAALVAAGPAQREALRERYLAATDGGDGRIIVDKSPLGTIYAGLLPLIFPDARIVLLTRHPYDVCLSCYMHDFPFSRSAGALTAPVSAARLYAAVMDLWQLYTANGAPRALQLRYEDLIDTPADVLAGLLAGLGVEWSDAVLEFAHRGRERAVKRRPNYAEVSRPLYRGAEGRWRRYAALVEPLRGPLAAYVERLGYAAD